MNENGEGNICILPNLLIQESEIPLLIFSEFCLSWSIKNIINYGFFGDEAILYRTIDSIEQINDFILSLICGEEQIYLSSDTPCQFDEDQQIQGE